MNNNKRVVTIVAGIPAIKEVPMDWIRCSVSGEYRPAIEFMTDGVQTRTNCTRTKGLSLEDMEKESEQTKKIQNGPGFQHLAKTLSMTNSAFEYSIPVSEMIEQLQKIQQADPTARVLMTQNGYYADGKFADIHYPEKQLDGVDGISYYSIGNSSQNY